MEPTAFLTSSKLSAVEWLHYYFNQWSRNAIARTIDVQSDMTLMEKNPNEQVQVDSQNPMELKFVPIAERLEMRKIALQDALNILESIESVMSHGIGTDGNVVENGIENYYWSPEFLKVSDVMAKATQEPEPAVDTTPVETEQAPVVEVAPEVVETTPTLETTQQEAESQAVEGETKA